MTEHESDTASPIYPEADTSPTHEIREADARDIPLDDNSVDFIVTSPPYWQKRDYGFEEQIGQEDTPDDFVSVIIDALSEWQRVLRSHGSVFLNIGDTYEKRSLVGIPGMVAQAARDDGWLVRNEIRWAKDGGMPEPASNRLANRHEPIFHLTQNNDYYYDLWGYSHTYGNGSNPGDVWNIGFEPNTGDHLAPFPGELVQRAVTLGCPPAVCTKCGEPRCRELRRTDKLDPDRPQARRAMEIYDQSDLTKDHIRAIQSVGISDAGKAREIQDGTGRNAKDVQKLADEAKDVLGGYFREFTFAKKKTDRWTSCDCDAPTKPGVVLDPFCGSGTTLEAAASLGFSTVGVDLDQPETVQQSLAAITQD
jgi:DNA modification methylase